MKTTVSRRGIKGGKRPDTNQMRDWLAKGQQVTCLGVVRKFPGQTSHFEINTDHGTAEILVDVELMPSGARVACRLGFGNQGVYSIPKPDQEVAVLCPYDPQSLIKDPLDFEPIIVGVLDVNTPSDLTDETSIVLKASKVLIYDGTGGVPLALKSDVDNLASVVSSHTHPVSGVTVGSGSTTSSVTGATIPAAAGTTILKGK